MKADPTVLIIGAGMAGLSAGCYAQMNGFHSRIFEMGHRAGGLCQSWERDGYTINGCIHWLVGSGEANAFHAVWQELGVVPHLQFYNHDRYGEFEFPEATVTLYADADRLEAHLLELAPEDEGSIRAFCRGVRVMAASEMPMLEAVDGLGALLRNARLMLTNLGLIRETMKWWKLTIGDFAARLQSPVLREAFTCFWYPETSAITLLMTLAFLDQRSAGYPIGGSSHFIDQVERRYRRLGGAVEYGAKVDEILVEEGRAVGIRLADGTACRADYVISAADRHATLYSLLKGAFVDAEAERHYRELPLFPPLLFAAFGVADPMKDVPASVGGIHWKPARPLRLGDREVPHLSAQVYNFDPTLAPAGKTTITILLDADYDYWTDLYRHPPRYVKAKEEVLNALTGALEARFPGIAGKIEMRDLSTPVTFYQYTGNYRGSYEGWLPTPRALRTQMHKTLPGLDGFFQIGHWVEPGGGLPPAALSGRNVVKALCKMEGLPFQARKKRPVRL